MMAEQMVVLMAVLMADWTAEKMVVMTAVSTAVR